MESRKGGIDVIITKKELRDNKMEYTRAQIAERAIEIAVLCVKNGSYKNAVACIGRMVSLSKTIDEYYWDGKFHHGASLERYYLLSNMSKNHPDKDTEVN